MTGGNFTFLSGSWESLSVDATRAEKYAQDDPRAAAIYARRSLEIGLKWLYKNDSKLRMPYDTTLASLIYKGGFQQEIPRGLFLDVKFIHKLGNLAAHDDKTIQKHEGLKTVSALHSFLRWLARVYTKDGAEIPAFDQNLLPRSQKEFQAEVMAVVQQRVSEARAAEEKAENAARKLTQSEGEIARLKAELEALQAVKETNKKSISSDEYSEAQTREAFIDVMLREAGWDLNANNVIEYEVSGMPNNQGKGFVDYVLWGDDGKPVALVEAKRTGTDPKVGKQQAKLYADCLEAETGQRPIIYYSNGYQTWMWDDTTYPPREVHGFSRREELQWKIKQRTQKKDLKTLQSNPEIAGRHYQMEAAARVMHTFGEEHKRKALVVMATGTGKTRLSISLVEMLMRAGWVRRVLFLADRVSLVNQAKRNFKALLPDYNVASLLDDKEDKARILFSTYPTMLNCIDGTKKNQDTFFSVGHFDLIIIDEAHRSVYQKYGAIFDYFDSLLLGLTATPRGEVDRNTYKLFELSDHQPTFSYELEQAVEDEFLVPPRAISIAGKFQREGIKYADLSPEEQDEFEEQEEFYDKETGELLEEIPSPALNKWLFNEDTVNKVLIQLMEHGLKVEGGDKLGKTIIFAKSSKHADFILEIFDKNYPKLAGRFARKIDYSVKYAQSIIDDFSIKEKDPQIAVSVDMLDTGIDVPEVVNLVFFKPVKSKTKYMQMIGRGTRLCEGLYGSGDHKTEFLVFDFCQNFEFFDAHPEGFESRRQEPVKQKIFKRRLELAAALDEAEADPQLSTSLKDQLHGVVSAMDVDNFIVRRERRDVETFSKRESWDSIKAEDYDKLESKISGLPHLDEDDEYARRFDLLILNLQIATFRKAHAQEGYITRVKTLASALELKSAIPAVAKEMDLILDLQTDPWWKDVTLPLLEEVRRRVRDLAKFADKEPGFATVFTNFEDEFTESDQEFEIVRADANMTEYKKRVRRFISENTDHLTIRRLRNNEPISRTDLKALEEILFAEEGPISREAYEEIYGDRPLGMLVRATVGLSQKAAKEAFASFLSKAALHPDQIAFLDQIVDYLVKNGTMEPKAMFDSPFTHINDEGLTGLFDDDESANVVRLLKEVNEKAIANDNGGTLEGTG